MIRSITAMFVAAAFLIVAAASAEAQSVAKYPPGLISSSTTDGSESTRTSDSDDDGIVEASADRADVMLQREIDVLTMERRQLLVQFGIGHPTIQLYDAKIKAATKALASMNQRSRSKNGGDDADAGEVATGAAVKSAGDQAESIAQLRRAVITLGKRVAALEAQVKKLTTQDAGVDDLLIGLAFDRLTGCRSTGSIGSYANG